MLFRTKETRDMNKRGHADRQRAAFVDCGLDGIVAGYTACRTAARTMPGCISAGRSRRCGSEEVFMGAIVGPMSLPLPPFDGLTIRMPTECLIISIHSTTKIPCCVPRCGRRGVGHAQSRLWIDYLLPGHASRYNDWGQISPKGYS